MTLKQQLVDQIARELQRLALEDELGAMAARSDAAVEEFLALLRDLPPGISWDEMIARWDVRCAEPGARVTSRDLSLARAEDVHAHWDDRPVETFAQIVYRVFPHTDPPAIDALWKKLRDRVKGAGVEYHTYMVFDAEPNGTPCLLTVDPAVSPKWLSETVAWLLEQPGVIFAQFNLPQEPIDPAA
jgi:hypothetical protein